jgi:2-polyprenyl-3-methyl-5-hydroxy-6-metoxy-1,4-benzoquinol methylase
MRHKILVSHAVHCRICGQHSPKTPVELGSHGYGLERCGTCCAVLVGTKPDDQELQALYDRLFADGLYELHREEFEQLRQGEIPRRFFRERLLRRAARKVDGRRLVEVGGGTGAFGAIAERDGWDYVDYDISEEAVRCQREIGHAAILFDNSAPPPLPKQSTDVLAMWEVVEHIWDLHAYLRVIREALRPGGVFIFSTPNFDRPEYREAIRDGAPLSSPPVHLNFFTPESLRRTLALHRFERVRLSSNRVRRPQKGIHFLRTVVALHPPSTIYGIAS